MSKSATICYRSGWLNSCSRVSTLDFSISTDPKSKNYRHSEHKPPCHTDDKPPCHSKHKRPCHSDHKPPCHSDHKRPCHSDRSGGIFMPGLKILQLRYTPFRMTKIVCRSDHKPLYHSEYKPPCQTEYKPPCHSDHKRPCHSDRSGGILCQASRSFNCATLRSG